jgi:hypothetical protein
MLRHTLAALTLAACAVTVEPVADAPPGAPLSPGAGQCEGHSLTCSGCVARGLCMTGDSNGACGSAGLACNACSEPASECAVGVCVQPCSYLAECDFFCWLQPIGTPCDICGVDGRCYQNECYPVPGQPFPPCN